MQASSLRDSFRICRRRDADSRCFLPLKLQTVSYLLRFIDGTLERYDVTYTASIESKRLGQRWLYRGHVSRQVSLYNKAGERFDEAGIDRRMELTPDAGRYAMADWREWRECEFGPGAAFPDDEFEMMFQWLSNAFAASVMADKPRIEHRFRQMHKGVEAVSAVD